MTDRIAVTVIGKVNGKDYVLNLSEDNMFTIYREAERLTEEKRVQVLAAKGDEGLMSFDDEDFYYSEIDRLIDVVHAAFASKQLTTNNQTM